MDPIPLTIACAPLALYLLFLGAMNLRRRPLIMTGSGDIAALAWAVSGLLVVGPMNLFLPDAAAMRFGPLVWLLLLAFYGMCVLLFMLVSRPRLVIFNITPDQLRKVLEELVPHLDSESRIAGDAVQMPQLAVQFHLEPTPAMRNVTLTATGDHQSYSGWKRLHRELAAALGTVEVSPNPRGFSFTAIGLLLLGWPTVQLIQTPANLVAQQLRDILRI